MRRALFIITAALALAMPPLASAQSQVWWGASTDDSGANPANDGIGRVGTNGIGAGTVLTIPLLSGSEGQPAGLAADLAQGRFFWIDYAHSRIYRADLDGSNMTAVTTTSGNPYGLARDPATDRLYWPTIDDKIHVVTAADGSDKAVLYDNPAHSDWIGALAIAPKSNRLYWGNVHDNQPDSDLIGVAKLDGSGVLDPIDPVLCDDLQSIFGLAVDEDQGAIYRIGQLVSNGNYAIQRYVLADGSCSTLFQRGAPMKGMALDPDHNRLLYGGWFDENLGWVNLADPVQGGNLTTGTAPTGYLSAPMVLSPPQATADPKIATTGEQVGATITCDPVVWADSSPGMNLYRDPVSFALSWERDGVTIDGAITPELTPTEPGEYRCVRSATNAIGTTAATSAAILLAAAPTTPGATPPTTPPTTPGATPSAPVTAPVTAPGVTPSARLVGRIGVRTLGRGRSIVTARVALSAGTWSLRLARGAQMVRLQAGSRAGDVRISRAATSIPVVRATGSTITVRLQITGTRRGLSLRAVPTGGAAITLR